MTTQKYAAILSISAYSTDVAVTLDKIAIFFTPKYVRTLLKITFALMRTTTGGT